jgi:hypothetical protein
MSRTAVQNDLVCRRVWSFARTKIDAARFDRIGEMATGGAQCSRPGVRCGLERGTIDASSGRSRPLQPVAQPHAIPHGVHASRSQIVVHIRRRRVAATQRGAAIVSERVSVRERGIALAHVATPPLRITGRDRRVRRVALCARLFAGRDLGWFRQRLEYGWQLVVCVCAEQHRNLLRRGPHEHPGFRQLDDQHDRVRADGSCLFVHHPVAKRLLLPR